MEKHGIVPMKPGIVMLLDVGNIHAYVNKSKEIKSSSD
jgi:mannose-6-phosphate isomerase class I